MEEKRNRRDGVEPNSVELLKEWMEQERAPQLLMQNDLLRYANTPARQICPILKENMTAGEIFGEAAAAYAAFSGKGSFLFFGTLGALDAEFRVTTRMEYFMVEATMLGNAAADAAIRAVADSILKPLGDIMVTTPKILPLLESVPGNANMEAAAQINRGLYEILRVANHLRTTGNGDGGMMLRQKPTNICQWLDRFYHRALPLCTLAGKKLALKLPLQDYMCDLDADQMERALLSLLSNAMKFTGEDGEIELSLKKTAGNRIRISLRDNGCGIGLGEMGLVFRSYERQALIPNPKWGAGMGLPLTRRIVTAHGGNLFLESEKDVGTVVHLSLPILSGPAAYSLHSDVLTPETSGGFNRMLVELADVLPTAAFDVRGTDL